MTVPEPQPASRDAARIGVLDGLRASVLFVPLIHFTIEAARHWPPGAALPVYLSGVFGVVALDMFFVLSGFLITGILLDTKGAQGFFRLFYLRRAVRILPLYYGFLLLYLVLLPWLASWNTGAMALPVADQVPYWGHFVNVPYALHGRLAAYTGHFWSLSLEEQFYLVWPVVVHLSTMNRLRQVVLACLILTPLVRLLLGVLWPDTLAFYALTPARLDGLMLGALFAIATRSTGAWDGLSSRVRRAGMLGLCVAALMVLTFVLQPGGFEAFSPGRATLFLTGTAYLAAGIVAAMIDGRGGVFHRIVASSPMRRVGIYSYAIYLLHNPLGHILGQAGIVERPMAGTGIAATYLYALGMTALTVVIAAASWHLFERPLLRLRPSYPRSVDAPKARGRPDPPA